MNLACQRKKFDIIVGACFCPNYLNDIKNVIAYGFNYYTILHDKDINDHGELKTFHYHLILTSEKKVRASQVLNILRNILCCNAENIQIDQCINFTASLKYLIHLNATDKYQYDRDNLISNQNRTYINSLLDSQSYDYELTTDSLFDVIDKCKGDVVMIIKTIGISTYAYYRNTINDILKYSKFD